MPEYKELVHEQNWQVINERILLTSPKLDPQPSPDKLSKGMTDETRKPMREGSTEEAR